MARTVFEKLVDDATGHKSKHYTPTMALDYERRKAEAESAKRPAVGPVEAGIMYDRAEAKAKSGRPEYSSMGSPGQIGHTGSTYSHEDFGLSGYKPPPMAKDEEQAVAAKAAMDRITSMANTQASLNNAADQTRFGGQFTDSGFQKLDNDAFKNAQDRMRAKSMMRGLGGSMTRIPGGG